MQKSQKNIYLPCTLFRKFLKDVHHRNKEGNKKEDSEPGNRQSLTAKVKGFLKGMMKEDQS